MLGWETVEPAAWFCARTQPKHEHIAAACLARQLGLEVFHPRLRMERASRRGVLHVIEPLFPCYVFVRCPQSRLPEVRFVTGVSAIVHFARQIPVVPDAVIAELQEFFAGGEPVPVEERFVPGVAVTVAEGTFLGFSGVVLRATSGHQRVQILLEFLGRTTVAEVDRRSLTLENRWVADCVPHLAVASPRSLAVP